jgi:hypothetical protein
VDVLHHISSRWYSSRVQLLFCILKIALHGAQPACNRKGPKDRPTAFVKH